MQEQGWFITPTVFLSEADTTIAQEEIFGPVCTVILFDESYNFV